MTDPKHTTTLAEITERYIVEQIEAGADAAAAAVRAELEPKVAAAEEAKRAAEGAAAAARNELQVVKDDRAAIAKALATSEDELEAARSRIRELEAAQPDPDPEPVVKPLLGACPLTGGATSAAVARVTDRWGAGIAVRLFDGDGLSSAPAEGAAGRLLISWKPAASSPITLEQVAVAVAPLPAGSKVCVWHEPDVKYRKTLKASGAAAAKTEVDRYKARAREFYSIVKRIRPDLDVMAVLSGWTFDPSTEFDPLDYIELGTFDVLGLDLDGLDGPKDFLPVIEEAQDWMTERGITRWTIAEYALRLTADYTAEDRAAWLRTEPAAILALSWPPEELCLFESTSYPTTELTTPAEIDAWNAQLAK